jgi:hypothetical protein
MPPIDWEKITNEHLESAFEISTVNTKNGEKVSHITAIMILCFKGGQQHQRRNS